MLEVPCWVAAMPQVLGVCRSRLNFDMPSPFPALSKKGCDPQHQICPLAAPSTASRRRLLYRSARLFFWALLVAGEAIFKDRSCYNPTECNRC